MTNQRKEEYKLGGTKQRKGITLCTCVLMCDESSTSRSTRQSKEELGLCHATTDFHGRQRTTQFCPSENWRKTSICRLCEMEGGRNTRFTVVLLASRPLQSVYQKHHNAENAFLTSTDFCYISMFWGQFFHYIKGVVSQTLLYFSNKFSVMEGWLHQYHRPALINYGIRSTC